MASTASIIPSQRDNLKFVQPTVISAASTPVLKNISFWNLLPFHLLNMKDMDAFGQSLTAAVVEKMSSQSHALGPKTVGARQDFNGF